MSGSEIEKIARETAERYNRYRSPEAIINVLSVENSVIEVVLSGSFCRSCGVYDWIEDYKYELIDLTGRQVDIIEVEQIDDESYKVKFRIHL